jgi:hypothetical protein
MPDEFTSLSAAGKQFSDPEFLRKINEIPAAERADFTADPAVWLGNAGYPVPAGLSVSVELNAAEQAASGVRENVKYQTCVGPSWARICYAHGPGEH